MSWHHCGSAPGPRGSCRVWFPEESRGGCGGRRDHRNRRTDVTAQGGGGTAAGGWPGQSPGRGTRASPAGAQGSVRITVRGSVLVRCFGFQDTASPRSPQQRCGESRPGPLLPSPPCPLQPRQPLRPRLRLGITPPCGLIRRLLAEGSETHTRSGGASPSCP